MNLGLTGKTGTVSVPPPPGELNPLYAKGFLKQSASTAGGVTDVHWITYGDGGDFFWLGDAAWAATMQATPEEWKAYVNDRSNRKFSVVQLGLAPHWAWTGAVNPDPFTTPTGCLTPASSVGLQKAPFFWNEGDGPFSGPSGPAAPACNPAVEESPDWLPCDGSKPNSAFWQRLDQMVECANRAGIVVLVTGVHKPAGIREGQAPELIPTVANAKAFARYLAARLAGNFVIFSPGFDDGTTPADRDRIDAIGEELESAAPRHLVTNHFGTMSRSNDPYTEIGNATDAAAALRTETWHGFQLYQSGFANQDLQKISHRPLALAQALRGFTDPRFASPRRKRAVNSEAIYDHGYNELRDLPEPTHYVDRAPESWRHFSRSRARQTAWSSLLGGAAGYSLGVMGIWEWGLCGNPDMDDNPLWCNQNEADSCGETPTPYPGYRNPTTAAGQAIAADMTRLREIVTGSGLDWVDMVTSEQDCDATDLACIVDNPPICTTGCTAYEQQRMTLARDADTMLVYVPSHLDPYNDAFELRIDPALGFETTDGGGNRIVPGVFKSASGEEVDTLRNGVHVTGNVFQFSVPSDDPPGGEIADWVLVLAAQPGEGFGQPLVARVLEDPEAGTSAVLVTVPDESEPLGARQVDVSGSTPAAKSRARALRIEEGQALVTWVQADPGSAFPSSSLLAQRIGSDGWPHGPALTLAAGIRELGGYSISRSGPDEYLVAWNERSETGAEVVRWLVLARDATELASGGSIEAAEGEELGRPRTACDEAGSCLAYWFRSGLPGGRSRIEAFRFTAESGEAMVSSPIPERELTRSWLLSQQPVSGSRVTVRWEEQSRPLDERSEVWSIDYDLATGASGTPRRER